MDTNNYTKSSIIREILLYALGYLTGLKYGVIPINKKFYDEDNDVVLSSRDPFLEGGISFWIEKNNINNSLDDIEDILGEINELDTIREIVPEHYNETIDRLINDTLNLLSKIPDKVLFDGKSLLTNCLKKVDFITLPE